MEKNQETKKKHENYKTETEDPSIRHQQTMKAKEPKRSKGEIQIRESEEEKNDSKEGETNVTRSTKP